MIKLTVTIILLSIMIGCENSSHKSSDNKNKKTNSEESLEDQENNKKSLGVGQGNGLIKSKVYYENYNFGLSYHNDLIVKTHTEQNLELNSKLNKDLESPNFSMRIYEDQNILRFLDLKKLVSRQEDLDFFPIKNNDFDKLIYETFKGKIYHKTEYVFISTGIYVRIEIKVIQTDLLFEEIKNIGNSIMPDHTPPQIVSLTLQQNIIEAGES